MCEILSVVYHFFHWKKLFMSPESVDQFQTFNMYLQQLTGYWRSSDSVVPVLYKSYVSLNAFYKEVFNTGHFVVITLLSC